MRKSKPRTHNPVKVGIAQSTPTTLVVVPEAIYLEVEKAALVESAIYGRRISPSEYLTRAAIDRIGVTRGTRHARRLFRQLFNGIGYLELRDTPSEPNTNLAPRPHPSKRLPPIDLGD